MRWGLLVVGIAVVGCKNEVPAGAKLVTRVPHVDKLDVVAGEPADSLPPPIVVVVDETGKLGVTSGPAKWSALATYAPPLALRQLPADALGDFVRDAASSDQRVRDRMGSLDKFLRERAAARAMAPPEEPDPPPPEEPDEPSPPEDDDEGSAALVLPEKRGEPAKPVEPPQPRQLPSLRGRYSSMGGFSFGRSGPGPAGHGIGGPIFYAPVQPSDHLVAVIGEPVPAVLAAQAVIAVDPKAIASAMVDAVAATEGALLVEVGGALRVLRVQFTPDRDGPGWARSGTFIELRASASGLEVEGVPSPPTKLAWDLAALATTVTELAGNADLKAAPYDILVSEDITAQQLVDLIVTLDRAGAKAIGIGKRPAPDDASWKLRGRLRRIFRLVYPISIGGLHYTREDIMTALRKCYEDALTTNPTIAGVAELRFSIAPKGKVTTATTTGIDPLVGDCFASTIKTFEFPTATSTTPVNGFIKISMRPYP